MTCIQTVASSEEGRCIVTAGMDGHVHLMSIHGEFIRTIARLSGIVYAIATAAYLKEPKIATADEATSSPRHKNEV